MAWLKKYINRNTFLTIIGLFNVTAAYVISYCHLEPLSATFILTAGNLIISWLGVESGHAEEPK